MVVVFLERALPVFSHLHSLVVVGCVKGNVYSTVVNRNKYCFNMLPVFLLRHLCVQSCFTPTSTPVNIL